jgi:GAF domain-containing protein
MAYSSLLPPPESRETFRDRTLARLTAHLGTLIEVDAVAFVTVGDRPELVAGWFADERLREPLCSLPPAEIAAPALLLAGGIPAAVAPLRAEAGRTLGVLAVASVDPARPLREEDLRSVEVVADLAAIALERAALLDAEQRRDRRELRLKEAGEAVAASLELDEVYRRVVEHAADLTGASKALITRAHPRAGELRRQASVDRSDDSGPLTLGATGFGHVARRRRPVLRASPASAGADAALMRREGLGSLMHAPIELGPRLYGVLTVAHEEPGRFGEEELGLLARLARSAAAAIANATDFGRERRLARSLTLGFVPQSMPALPGYETGLLYAPALGEPTGGDLYGAWRLPGGDVAVLVGDVAGKGVENAALSAMVRFFVEARSWDARSPAVVLEQANALLMGRLPTDTFVTAFYGVLTPGSLRWACAGHLPPLHVHGGRASLLECRGLPLGVDASPGYRETELPLAPGDLLLAFTDGLIEARRGTETYGLDRLAGLVEDHARTLGPEDLVRTVHEEVADWSGGLSDDAVALALRRVAPPPPAPLQLAG